MREIRDKPRRGGIDKNGTKKARLFPMETMKGDRRD